MEQVGRLGWIQIDCRDPVELAAFWGAVLGLGVDDDHLGDPPQYVALLSANPDLPQVSFQRVLEPKTMKNRLHFDLDVDDVDGRPPESRSWAAGGSRLRTSASMATAGA